MVFYSQGLSLYRYFLMPNTAFPLTSQRPDRDKPFYQRSTHNFIYSHKLFFINYLYVPFVILKVLVLLRIQFILYEFSHSLPPFICGLLLSGLISLSLFLNALRFFAPDTSPPLTRPRPDKERSLFINDLLTTNLLPEGVYYLYIPIVISKVLGPLPVLLIYYLNSDIP